MANQREVRMLNEQGIARFSRVEWARTGSAGDPPKDILWDDEYSEVVVFSNGHHRTIDIESHFSTMREMVEVIDDCLGTELDLSEVATNGGLWAWFSLLFYEKLRKGEPGSWSGAARPRFIPSGKSLTYYRHQVFCPYALYKMHGQEAVSVFLHGASNNWPEVNEQLLCVSGIVTSSPIIAAINDLYYDPSTDGGFQFGVGGKGGGSSRRWRSVYWQLYETYNLRSMTKEDILEVLPSEFDRFILGGAT